MEIVYPVMWEYKSERKGGGAVISLRGWGRPPGEGTVVARPQSLGRIWHYKIIGVFLGEKTL